MGALVTGALLGTVGVALAVALPGGSGGVCMVACVLPGVGAMDVPGEMGGDDGGGVVEDACLLGCED